MEAIDALGPPFGAIYLLQIELFQIGVQEFAGKSAAHAAALDYMQVQAVIT